MSSASIQASEAVDGFPTKPKPGSTDAVTVSESLDRIGTAGFHYVAGVACGVANAGDGVRVCAELLRFGVCAVNVCRVSYVCMRESVRV